MKGTNNNEHKSIGTYCVLARGSFFLISFPVQQGSIRGRIAFIFSNNCCLWGVIGNEDGVVDSSTAGTRLTND